MLMCFIENISLGDHKHGNPNHWGGGNNIQSTEFMMLKGETWAESCPVFITFRVFAIYIREKRTPPY